MEGHLEPHTHFGETWLLALVVCALLMFARALYDGLRK